MECIATFFNHSGAIRFRRACVRRGWKATLAPVPRALSSSCGTCVIYSPEEEAGKTPERPEPSLPSDLISEELEQVIVCAGTDGGQRRTIYRAEGI